ncbi:SPW repeat protein [Actinomadura chokoriensis]|uniref:SPW repeat protein n=1 Tax=Actinomadura chokoriensis TaxID=454156 RepID=A0ABV4QTL2_9ACTN
MHGLIALTGLYLAASPWIVGFSGLTDLAINNLIMGVALTLLAAGFASTYGRTHTMSWVAPVVGIWTIIAPWAVAGDMSTTSTVWSNVVTNVVTGAITVALRAAAMGVAVMRKKV